MSEVEKLYENADVEDKNINNQIYKDLNYPQFTAEKQLEIVKLILFSTWWLNLKGLQFGENFKDSLAELVNDIWQNLPEEEKQQIRGILK